MVQRSHNFCIVDEVDSILIDESRTPLIISGKVEDKSNLYLYSCVAFWFLTINHSSMRIAAPAFVYGLSLISIVNAKKKSVIHRK